MDFGTVAPGSSSSLEIRICDVGGSVLTISKSKPPLGVIRASAPGIDLHESQQIPVQQCLFVAPTEVGNGRCQVSPSMTFTEAHDSRNPTCHYSAIITLGR